MPEIRTDLPVSRSDLCRAPGVYRGGDRVSSGVEEKQNGHSAVDRSFRALVVRSPHLSKHLPTSAEIGGPPVKADLRVPESPCHASCARVRAGFDDGFRDLLREELEVALNRHDAIRNDEIIAHDDGCLVRVSRADEDLGCIDFGKRLAHPVPDRVQHLPRQVYEVRADHDRALLNFVPLKQLQHEHLRHHRGGNPIRYPEPEITFERDGTIRRDGCFRRTDMQLCGVGQRGTQPKRDDGDDSHYEFIRR